MKIVVTGTPDELKGREEVFVRELAKALRPHNPELSDTLEKAAKAPFVPRSKVMREAADAAGKLYAKQLGAMNDEILELLKVEIEK